MRRLAARLVLALTTAAGPLIPAPAAGQATPTAGALGPTSAPAAPEPSASAGVAADLAEVQRLSDELVRSTEQALAEVHEAQEAERRRRLLFVGLAAALLLIIGVRVFLGWRRGRPRERTSSGPPARPRRRTPGGPPAA